MPGRVRARNFATAVPTGEKSTLVRSGSESVFTGQRQTPQDGARVAVAWAVEPERPSSSNRAETTEEKRGFQAMLIGV